jgi:hypothetical protein
MIDQLFNDPENVLGVLASAITLGVFIYIIILSVLQARQVQLLQQKVHTDADSLIRFSLLAYILIQILLFVIVLLFL